MEHLKISDLINELTNLKKRHGDIKIYHIVYGSIEKVYTVSAETLIKKDTNETEKVVLIC